MTWKQRIKKSPLVLWTISGPIETHVSVSKRESIQTLKYLEQRGVDPEKAVNINAEQECVVIDIDYSQFKGEV